MNQLDMRFERFRLKDKHQEKALLHSMIEGGLREGLQCVESPKNHFILLDGFKRYRCATKLGLKVVPVVSMGEDEAAGILQLIRVSNAKSLNLLEQASFVDELNRTHGMSVRDIARLVERSPAWVSVRLGMIREISEGVRNEIFSGRFPARSYMYTLRQFTRVNKVKQTEVDTFVKAVSGKGLSIRNLDMLAYGFFRGGDALREQIKKGNLDWTLAQLRRSDALRSHEASSLSEIEQRVLRDLELTQKYMARVLYGVTDARLKERSFFLQAHLLIEGILSKASVFIQTLKVFHDQKREAKSSRDTS